MNNKEYIIYRITNIINDKVYIGQTSGNLQNRFKGHCRKESNCIKLKNAINKYGKENFSIEQIDEAFSKEEADAKEKLYIKQYNSLANANGYNIEKGGRTTVTSVCTKVYCCELDKIFDSIRECCKELNLKTESMVSAVCVGRKPTYKGYHFCYIKNNGQPDIEKIKFTKPFKAKVLCVETGKIFNSIKEASEFIGKSISLVQSCIVGRCETAGGYHWKYLEKEVA